MTAREIIYGIAGGTLLFFLMWAMAFSLWVFQPEIQQFAEAVR